MDAYRPTLQRPASLGVFGRLFGSAFFLIFFAAGTFFAAAMLKDLRADWQTYGWTRTDCKIVSAEVSQVTGRSGGVGDYEPVVTFRYKFAGEDHQTTGLWRKHTTYQDYGQAADWVAKYPPGADSICYVNPEAPTQAILHRANLWTVFILLFPMVFMTIGAGGIYAIWRRPRYPRALPLSDSGRGQASPVLIMLFFSVFLIVGLAALYPFFIRPISKVIAAKNWPSVGCTVIASGVRSHTGKSTTYSVEILYEYEFAGVKHRSSRYGFMNSSSSGYASKQAIVDENPSGSHRTCFVNPDYPTEAVLDRGFSGFMLMGLIPLIFAVIGGSGLWFTSKTLRARASSRTVVLGAGTVETASGLPVVDHAFGSSRELKPTFPRVFKLAGTILAALFWNGIISVFVLQVISGWKSGHPQWFLTLFLVPFVLVGAGMIVGIGYYTLALFTPRPHLIVSPGIVRLGDTVQVQWRMNGRVGVIESLTLRWEGREEAQYRRGTNTVTDTNVFADQELAHVTTRTEIQGGTAQFTVPENLMHSFSAPHNRITWSIYVEGKISGWPDVREAFQVNVMPAVKKPAYVA